MGRELQDRRKRAALAAHGALNPHPERVRDRLVQESDFFDPHDLVQVKYEMVRRVSHEGASVSGAAQAFGFSRPSCYQAQEAVRREGVVGLLPRRRGPKGAHKLTPEVLAVLDRLRAAAPGLGARGLAQRLWEERGIRVHPRSIERALARRGKKRRPLP